MGVVNAGDGIGHPSSQALLDLMTIKQEFGDFKDLKIGIVGDIKHSRVANSNADYIKKIRSKSIFSGPKRMV